MDGSLNGIPVQARFLQVGLRCRREDWIWGRDPRMHTDLQVKGRPTQELDS